MTTNIEKKLLSNTFVSTSGINKNVINYGILKPEFDKKKVLKIFNKKFDYVVELMATNPQGLAGEKTSIGGFALKALKKLRNKKIIINVATTPITNIKIILKI